MLVSTNQTKCMQIKKLVIRNLYGYINKKIEFNDDLTLLVGINGCDIFINIALKSLAVALLCLRFSPYI